MERGDLLTIIAGIAIVIIIAIAVKYGNVIPANRFGSFSKTPVTSPAPITTESAVTTTATVPTVTTLPLTIVPAQVPTLPDPVPVRIYYTSKPLDYPVFKLPEHMETFGGSSNPWADPDVVTFAYVTEPRGGLTQEFRVPYGLWGMNITVEAWTRPQNAQFNMVLCYAKDGRIIDGVEILNRGSVFRSIQVSNTDMYLIIHTDYVDRFLINFITPRSYYNNVTAAGSGSELVKY